jgi:hypothetical protein
MNEYYKILLNNNIKKAVLDAASASMIKHPSLTGRLREIIVKQLLNPLLNDNFDIGTGKVVDYNGVESKEIDICIYSKNLLPPFFFATDEKVAIFPMECVLSCIEVKSTFSKKNIFDAYKNFHFLEAKLTSTTGIHDQANNPCAHIIVKPHYRLFIFQADLKNFSPESFLKIYKLIDDKWDSAPLISSVCIVGQGSLCFTSQGWLHMAYDEENNCHEEVITFLATTIQDLPGTEESRGVPRMGYYLTDPYKLDRIIKGQLHVRPWNPGKTIFKVKNLD